MIYNILFSLVYRARKEIYNNPCNLPLLKPSSEGVYYFQEKMRTIQYWCNLTKNATIYFWSIFLVRHICGRFLEQQ